MNVIGIRRSLASALLLGLVACGAPTSGGAAWTLADTAAAPDEATGPAVQDADSGPDLATEDAAAELGAEVAAPVQTTGAQVSPALPAPSFSQVVDSAGAPVAASDLQGHWTVLWFYPAASTIG